MFSSRFIWSVAVEISFTSLSSSSRSDKAVVNSSLEASIRACCSDPLLPHDEKNIIKKIMH